MSIEPFNNSVEHILAELERIELLIRARVFTIREQDQGDTEFRGLYISEQELEAILRKPVGMPQWSIDLAPIAIPDIQSSLAKIAEENAKRKNISCKQGISLRLRELEKLFGFSTFDLDAFLICLAPELDIRYERLFAYLQDDVTKKRPTIDLVLNLLCGTFEEKIIARQRFSQSSPLLRHNLLQIIEDPACAHPTLIGKFLKAEDRVVSYVLDSDHMDNQLLSYVECVELQVSLKDLVMQPDMKSRLNRLVNPTKSSSKQLVCYFHGPYGVGKRAMAEALCCQHGMKLCVVDGKRLVGHELAFFETNVRMILREVTLQKAAIYWEGFDALLAENKRMECEILLRELEKRPGTAFLAGNMAWEPVGMLLNSKFINVQFPLPSHQERVTLWTRALKEKGNVEWEAEIEALANTFNFSGGKINDATRTAINLAAWRDPDANKISISDLYTACRLQSNRNLVTLAQKIIPQYTWNDIVLPAERLQQLQELANYVKNRALVYEEWGFNRKLSLGKGLNILFAGPSGTGKTMAAEIIAGDLGLDLYKIDLSTMVSKYIGETEKNLAKLFEEAETSHAILFFDEADALFGRRSEVRDSHDRYANIEVGYLLQKMEEYKGVVILATNFRRNMDEAFIRRMHAAIEFPFPNEQDRGSIWQRIWPEQTPRSQDLDLAFLAKRFELSGGNIRNIAVAAAFLASENGRIITMDHLLHATRREYQKMGKVVSEGEFKGIGETLSIE